mgnify:CR=1 FL=1
MALENQVGTDIVQICAHCTGFQLFQLKWNDKQLVRQSEKAEKASKDMKGLFQALYKRESCFTCSQVQKGDGEGFALCVNFQSLVSSEGNMEGAKIHAESSIREKNNAINCKLAPSNVFI